MVKGRLGWRSERGNVAVFEHRAGTPGEPAAEDGRATQRGAGRRGRAARGGGDARRGGGSKSGSTLGAEVLVWAHDTRHLDAEPGSIRGRRSDQ